MILQGNHFIINDGNRVLALLRNPSDVIEYRYNKKYFDDLSVSLERYFSSDIPPGCQSEDDTREAYMKYHLGEISQLGSRLIQIQ